MSCLTVTKLSHVMPYRHKWITKLTHLFEEPVQVQTSPCPVSYALCVGTRPPPTVTMVPGCATPAGLLQVGDHVHGHGGTRFYFRRTSMMVLRGKTKRAYFCCLRGGNCTVDVNNRKKCIVFSLEELLVGLCFT